MDRPLFQRKFTMNGEPVDLADFVSNIAINPRDAASIFFEVDALQPDTHMFFWVKDKTLTSALVFKEIDLYRME